MWFFVVQNLPRFNSLVGRMSVGLGSGVLPEKRLDHPWASTSWPVQTTEHGREKTGTCWMIRRVILLCTLVFDSISLMVTRARFRGSTGLQFFSAAPSSDNFVHRCPPPLPACSPLSSFTHIIVPALSRPGLDGRCATLHPAHILLFSFDPISRQLSQISCFSLVPLSAHRASGWVTNLVASFHRRSNGHGCFDTQICPQTTVSLSVSRKHEIVDGKK